MTPLVVFPSRYVRGAWAVEEGFVLDKTGEAPQLGHYWTDGVEGLRYEYPTDAHCVTYAIDGLAEPTPRLTKRIARKLGALGLRVVVRWAFLDVDNIGHKPWADPSVVDVGAVADHIADSLGARPGWYVTRCGYRLVWPLADPVGVEVAEDALGDVVRRVRALGYAVDQRCTDWTRFFRCPRVVREGATQQFPLDLGCI